MKVLILSQYYPPETGAPQNRLAGIAQQLKSLGVDIEVLTGFPNYPAYKIHEEYKGKKYMLDEFDGIKVHRCYIYTSQSKSLLKRLLSYFTFAFSAWYFGLSKTNDINLIFCESPPLFLGFTAVMLKRRKKAKLVFNVSDLWPESAVKLGLVTNKHLISLSTRLEHWIYKNSDYISGQTQGIVNDIHRRFPEKPIFWLRNGVNECEITQYLKGRNWRKESGYSTNDMVVYFGGLIGYAQGLEVIIKAAKRLEDYALIQFAIVGEGPEKEKLKALRDKLGANNVRFFPGVPKSEIVDIIASIDISIIHLRNIDLFKGAIPSKIFEILFLEKPILLGLEGEAKELFIKEGRAGWAFEPENDQELAACILDVYINREKLSKAGKNGAAFVKENFDRIRIVNNFWHFLQN